MTINSDVESVPVGEIVGKPEKRDLDRIRYQTERAHKIIEEHSIGEAAEILGKELADLEEERDEDPATGIKTRESGARVLERQIGIAREKGTPLSVVMFDLDGFKQVNDTQGHEAGNRAIKLMTDFLEERTSRMDIACRYGGDEFFLIMPGSSTEVAKGLANRIIGELPALMQEKGFDVTSSIGIAQLSGSEDPKDLLEKADKALLLAKENGKNRVEVFTLSE